MGLVTRWAVTDPLNRPTSVDRMAGPRVLKESFTARRGGPFGHALRFYPLLSTTSRMRKGSLDTWRLSRGV